jgi:hypothetical protein
LICFFSDHGDLLGDHHGWQKQNFFAGSCRIPFLLSWPTQLPMNASRKELVSLADLLGIATSAAGTCELRDGIDVLGMLRGQSAPRPHLAGMTEPPGSQDFKIMIVPMNGNISSWRMAAGNSCSISSEILPSDRTASHLCPN